MQCRNCTTGARETQQHIEECTYFRKYRKTFHLSKGGEQFIFCGKVIIEVDLKLANQELFDHNICAIDTVNDATQSETSSNEQGRTLPVSDGGNPHQRF